MNAWLIGIMVCLGLLVPVLLFFTGVVVLESVCAQWEEDEIRRIAASKDEACLVACSGEYEKIQAERKADGIIVNDEP